MPRYRVRSVADSLASPVEFDVCARCDADAEVLRAVVNDKLRIPADGGGPILERITHRSYDFQPHPTPCISCARVLTSDDD